MSRNFYSDALIVMEIQKVYMSRPKAIKILLLFFPLLTVCLKEIEYTLHLDANIYILKIMFMSI